MASSTNALPAPSKDQKYVTVSAIAGGFITLPDKSFVSPADPDAKRTVPSLAFLITHPGLDKPSRFWQKDLNTDSPIRLLFDLGLRSDAKRYISPQQAHLENRRPYHLGPGVAQTLRTGGINPSDIDAIVLSHVHYDHHGDPEDFPDTNFIIGPGAKNVLKHGVGGAGSHQHFQHDLLPDDKIIELDSPSGSFLDGDWKWKPLSPFEEAIDLFSDGSVYIINTPGHLPGHINLLCRTGPAKWIYLAGDAFHDPRLLTGEKQLGFWKDNEGRELCIHLDPAGARKSIERIRTLLDVEGVEIIAAHDNEWYERNKQRMFPKTL